MFPFAFFFQFLVIMSLLSATRAVVSPSWAVREKKGKKKNIAWIRYLSKFWRLVPSDNLIGSLLESCLLGIPASLLANGTVAYRLSTQQNHVNDTVRVLVRSQRRRPGSCIAPPSTCDQPVSVCLPHGRSANAVTGWSGPSPD